MDLWITVVVAAIVAISTLAGAFIQNWFSHRRFKIEIGRAIDVESRKRKWEVRSVPLLKLRSELARMATTINKVVSLVNKQFDQDGNAKKKTVEELQDAMGAWEHYVVSGEVHSILFIQYDNDIIKKVNDIEDEYIAFCSNINKAKELQSKEVEEAKRSQGKIWEMVFEVQELINKKLEEL